MKKLLTLILAFVVFCSSSTSLFAINDPLRTQNNKFGIHIHDENDLSDAAALVNGNGGDWGYVTLVVRYDQRNLEEMQRTFNKMRKLHLIPIIRIATKPVGDSWAKGDLDQIDDWVSFLGNLSWVTENRYVIIGNEPNHATEWGGEVNPEEYSDYLLSFATALKKNSSDFYIMPAGFDASAPNTGPYMDEAIYLERMIKKNPTLFTVIDGWSSHSYPNPGFSGLVTDKGRGSIRTYEWELDILASYGVTKKLPIFITETGWIHDMGGKNPKEDTQSEVSKQFVRAFEEVWSDDRIVAVTPFILNYTSPPFDSFSWKKVDGTFYDFYHAVSQISKLKGKPIQRNVGEIQAVLLPEVLTIDNQIYGLAYIKNTGQKIWKAGISETITVEDGTLEITSTNPIIDIEPGQMGTVLYKTVSKQSQTIHFDLGSDKILLSFLNY
jgi:hypothetical protein